MNTKDSYSSSPLANADISALLDELQTRVQQTQKDASLAMASSTFSPIAELGQRIRAERKKQGLTLNDLCELSGIAYATLNKIEQGRASARIDTVSRVAHALGMKLWIG